MHELRAYVASSREVKVNDKVTCCHEESLQPTMNGDILPRAFHHVTSLRCRLELENVERCDSAESPHFEPGPS